MKKIVSKVLVILMVLSFFAPIPVYADDTPVDSSAYIQNDTYSYFVSATTGKVVRVDSDNFLYADVEETDGNELSDGSLFKIENYSEVSRIQIVLTNNKVWKADGNNIVGNGGKQGSIHGGSWEGFEVETDSVTGTSKIKTYNGKYIVLSDDKLVVGTNDSTTAATFYIMDPVHEDSTVYIEHVGSGKYIQVDGTANNLVTVTGEVDEGDVIGDDLRFNTMYGEFENFEVINFISKAYPKIAWQSGGIAEVKQIANVKAGGWESIIVAPNGDGTISFKDSQNRTYITVTENNTLERNYKGELTDNEKFIIHSVVRPKKVTDVTSSQVNDTEMTISWSGVKQSIYTGYVVVATPPLASGKEVITSAETTSTSVRLEGLEPGTNYQVTIRTVNAHGSFGETKPIEVQTKNGPCPVQVTKISAEESGSNIKITWDAVDKATSYQVYRARSAFDTAGYQLVADNVTSTSYVDNTINAGKYNNYYKAVAVNENGASDISDVYTSLEMELFGENMIIFAETDEVTKIDAIVDEIFTRQNDYAADAQFNENRYAINFKPGDYTTTKIMELGFYTHIGGLGKTPYDVTLNNIEIPAYLDGQPGTNGANATCNFWRSTENVSIMDTGDNTSKFGSWRGGQFNWAVAQAAPLRRVYSERVVNYDWNWGWASGGYTSDCLFTGVNNEGNTAGTFSGQQFFTRNSKLVGNAFGTTLNNFFMGVESPNLPNASTGDALINGNGYSNWAIPNANGEQQVFTNIESTPIIREKPFLFIDDDGEYKVFVPALNKDTKGTTWSKNNMGAGEVVSLDAFYIAKEGDTASSINEKLEAGKHIFFTPGVYHAEETIKVNKENTIVLGTGMASIIPDNEDTAMRVADKDGITIAGLIFDAGSHSKSLLEVGEDGKHIDHSDNPTLLADLFFRVGGTTSELTKADDALIINSDDVIGDHFWIWRADHGAGVEWYGNESKHGLIVNGDNVNCYALFNEHFQEYNTLWNGENGATYFYQNETAYDPISQEAWMNHDGTTNGYSSYKVANKVDTHYAVGLGIYNVFIFTGPGYDAMDVQIQLDSGIEVPNKKGVLIENACMQTFAKDDGVLQKINHIVNDTGKGVASGVDKVTGEKGPGWARVFMLSYQNGKAISGFNGDTVEQGTQPMNDPGDVDLSKLHKAYYSVVKEKVTRNVDTTLTFKINELDYTATSWSTLLESLESARVVLEDKGEAWAIQAEVDTVTFLLNASIEALESKCDVKDLQTLYTETKDKDLTKYTADSIKAVTDALAAAKDILETRDCNQKVVNDAIAALQAALDNLKTKGEGKDPGPNPDPEKPVTNPGKTVTNPGGSTKPNTTNKGKNKGVKTGDDSLIEVFGILTLIAAGSMVTLRKKDEEM